jgi:hypothetical protein
MSAKPETTTVNAEVIPASVQPNHAVSLSSAALSAAFSDIDIPRINVIQKMSEIEGSLGSVVLDKEHEILKCGEKALVVIVGATKRYKEDIPYDDDQIPKIVNSEEEARELARTSSFEILEFAEIVMLIPQIGDDDSAFPYPIGDTNYQLGKITVQKDAYRLTYKRLFTFATFNRSVPISARLWNFSSEPFSKGKYNWHVPTLSVSKEETPSAVAEFVNSTLNA